MVTTVNNGLPAPEVCLDFVNTLRIDRRRQIDDVADMVGLTHFLERDHSTRRAHYPDSPPDQRRLVTEAHHLRSALHLFLSAVAEEACPDAATAATLNRVLAAGPVLLRVECAATKPELSWSVASDDVLAILTPIVMSAALLSRSVRPNRLRCCEAEDCVRWFVDTSKSGRRRWCSMTTCGNRAKAARFRQRQAAG